MKRIAFQPPPPLELEKVRVYPLRERKHLLRLKEILVEPADPPQPPPSSVAQWIDECAHRILEARSRGAGVILIYGAHLIKNGGQLLLNRLMDFGWVTHLATNGAGMIHDWEFAFLGQSTESVRANVQTGTFGTWDETGRYLNLTALLAGLSGEGWGQAVGRFIQQDGCTLPNPKELEEKIRNDPTHPLTPARAELLSMMKKHQLSAGPMLVLHPYRNASVLAHAFRCSVPLTIHPGIGYDIYTNHPMFCGAAIGRAAAMDFRKFAGSVATLEGGVVINIGTAVMGPQVFEKSLSCVNNLRIQQGKGPVQGHWIYVVDIQDAGGWNWEEGEPPPDNPAYYLRFCKSFSRMGGTMRYVRCHNITFLHNLFHRLAELSGRPIRSTQDPEPSGRTKIP